MIEEWKQSEIVPQYEVSNLGRVRRIGKTTCLKEVSTKNKSTPWYPTVVLKGIRYYVHRLVAQTFIPNPDNLPQVNHIDGDKTNNRADNLEWSNASKNQIHAIKNNLHKTMAGAVTCKRPIIVFNKITNEISEYDSVQEAARETNVDPRAICRNAAGKRKSPDSDLEYWYADELDASE